MKKSILCFALLASLVMTGCGPSENTESNPSTSDIVEEITSISFAQKEYVISSGDAVTIEQNVSPVTYSFVGKTPSGVTLDASKGIISFDKTVANNTQLLYMAEYKELATDMVTVTLHQDIEVPELNFINPIDYVGDGDYIYVNNSLGLSNVFEVTTSGGVSVDRSSGRISMTNQVNDGDKFEVKVSSNTAEIKKTFTVAKENLASVKNNIQAAEKNGQTPVAYNIDFTNVPSDKYAHEFKGVIVNNIIADDTLYKYNKETQQIVLLPELLKDINPGEAELGLITSRNIIRVKLLMASKFIKTAEDLAGIGKSREALHGYYIMMNDIDLTHYLSPLGEGYNNGQGWDQIGVYHDVADGTAFLDTFDGTFDGNGHVVRGLNIFRDDTLAFNAGLFGYINTSGVVKNLGIENTKDTWGIKSFSGGIAGFNAGTIQNCWTNLNIWQKAGQRMLGGIVGRNTGSIDSCYVLGKCTASGKGEKVGAIVGLNEGNVTNCFAHKNVCAKFQGGGKALEDSIFFNTLEELKAYDFNKFDKTYWDHKAGELPTLKSYLDFYFAFNVSLKDNIAYVIQGKDYNFTAKVEPSNLADAYLDKITYSITSDDEHIILDGNTVHTAGATAESFILTATLKDDYINYTDSLLVKIYPTVTDIDISEVSDYLDEGGTYQLHAKLTPNVPDELIVWKLDPEVVQGVHLNGNILTSDEYVSRNKSFNIIPTYAGVAYPGKKVKINNFEYIQQNTTLRKGEVGDTVTFTMPEKADMASLKTYIDDKLVETVINGNDVTISNKAIKDNVNKQTGIVFRCANNGNFKAYATYLDKEAQDITKIGEYIELGSKEDFYTYFNMKDYDANRVANYSKTYVLTNDIDFNNETIKSIGGDKLVFTGKIIGQGHTIKNAVINHKEDFWQTNDDVASQYGVGFFKTFGGQIYDVIFDNIQVKGRNWLGCFAVESTEKAVIENVHMNHCSVNGWSGKVSKFMPGQRLGKISAVTVDYNTNY